MFKKIFVIVTDSLGIGELPDANLYSDTGANTYKKIVEAYPDIKIPNFSSLGINSICPNTTFPNIEPKGVVTRLKELSVGKDTLTGHFEIMGLEVLKPYPSFTETGFPNELIDMLEEFSGRKVLGNKSASGTEILVELGEEQLATKGIIVYTSADSVLQIAANTDIVPLDELYRICEYARKITIENKDWQVGRIIARPYIGSSKDNFERTPYRHDYALKPFDETTMDFLKNAGLDVVAIGKINDIFDSQGVTKTYPTKSNIEGMNKSIEMLNTEFTGLCFVNLVEFDSLYGHRRDVLGYKKCLEEFDIQLGEFISKMTKDDLLMIVSDHGNDPTHKGTDHTREYVPLSIYHLNISPAVIADQESFASVGATICDNFGVKMPKIGKSLLSVINNDN